ncbi:condensation domain-containing protein [Roseiconus lacunae]|uniref:condensation domain-containing protein n=1 Tax=Roseiconus lacunae TaxID=2605694 RepID=UPI001E5B54C9|nr:condensation domain-containing protein [Roseiconus lacunae]MCD0458200.1 condensation domain-containing protein [Roseiconus lacunae]
MIDTVSNNARIGGKSSERLSLEVREKLVDFLGFESIDEILPDEAFADLGTDSSQAVEFKLILESMYGIELKTSVLFDYPTVDQLVEMLADRLGQIELDGKAISPTDLRPRFNEHLSDSFELRDGDSFPLSETQQGLWYIGQSRQLDSSFHVPLLFQIDASHEFDPGRFDEALKAIVRRHPALRVTVSYDDSQSSLHQTVVPADTLAASRSIEPSGDLLHQFRKLVQQPMEMQSRPPIETYYAIDQQVTWVLIKVHHIVIDGLSAVPLVGELWTEYFRIKEVAGNKTDGDSSRIDDASTESLDTGFFQYLRWESDYLRSPQAEADRAYWKKVLIGAEGDVGLQPDRSSDDAPSDVGGQVGCVSVDLESHHNVALENLARELRCPPSAVLLSLYFVLLNRIGDKDDLVVTTPVSGRPGGLRGAYQSSVGCFINLVATRCQITKGTCFASLCQTVSETFLQAVQHGHLPFSEQLRASGHAIASDHGRATFPYSFTYQNIFEAWNDQSDWQRQAILDFALYQEIEDDLTLEVYELPNRRRLNWKYQSTRYSVELVRSWSNLLISLLEQVCDEPSVSIDSLAVRSESGELDHRSEFDRREAARTTPDTVIDWIEQAFEAFPDKVCVFAADGDLTYRQLNHRSRVLADKLGAAGFGPGDLIAINARRDRKTIVELIAVLRCGAAYLPIAVDEPSERHSEIIRQTSATELADALNSKGKSSELADAPSLFDEHTAYVLLTSGTSGMPKAVPIVHHSLVNLCHAMIDLYDLSSDDVVLQFASLTFDMSVEEIFPILCAGGAVVLCDEDRSPRQIRRLIERYAVSVLNLPPSYHRVIRETFDRTTDFYRDVRLVAFGGDSLSAETLGDVLRTVPRVFNAYGPTETTVNAMIAEWSGPPLQKPQVHLGRPIAGTAIAILDKLGRSVPDGSVGELCIWGTGVSTGYVRHASGAFDRQLFPGDPYPTRCYRTGDLARISLNDSDPACRRVELVGRCDHQINLHGFRIEPAEIEKVVESHSSVQAVAVGLADQDRLGMLYVGKAVDYDQWQEWLKTYLPDRMIPQVIGRVDRLPLTTRGKLDRAGLATQLRSIEGPFSRHDDQLSFVANDPTWFGIREILAEILHQDEISPSDRFAELGGHSLLAIIATAKLSDHFGITLQLKEFVSIDRLGELRSTIVGLLDQSKTDSNVQRGDMELSVAPLTPQQQRLWILQQLGQGKAYVIPAIADVSGSIDVERLRFALNAIGRRHEVLRMTIDLVDGKPVQRFHRDPTIIIETQSFSDRQRAREWIDRQAEEPFDFASGPLWKTSLANVEGDRSMLLILFHHVIIDAWSMRIFIEELQRFYAIAGNAVDDQLIRQNAPTGRYASYCARPLKESTASVTDDWKSKFQKVQDVQLWPDFQVPKKLSSAGRSVVHPLDAAVNELIGELCRELNLTKAAFWLACLRLYLHRRSGGSDFAVGMPHAGRDDSGTTDLMGFFVGTLVLRLDNPDSQNDVTVGDWLRHAQQTLDEALHHQKLSVDEIIAAVNPERRLDRSPLFQVMLSYAAEPVRSFDLGQATLRPVVPTIDQSKFEWTVSISENSDGSAALSLEYATDLFRESTAASVVKQISELATDLVTGVNSPLMGICNGDGTPSSFDRSEVIKPSDFEVALVRQSQRLPEQIAIDDGMVQLSYKELERQTRLQETDRPTDQTLRHLQPDRTIRTLIDCCKNYRHGHPFVFSNEAQRDMTLPNGTACLAMTSGTQGESKGVVVTGDALDIHNQAFAGLLRLSPKDRVAQYASPEFDLFFEEVFPTLRSGATLCLVPEEVRLDSRMFCQWVEQSRCTVLDLPTAFFHRWAPEVIASGQSGKLRAVVVGGEKLDRELAASWVQAFPNIELWNTYGPTEATIICAAHQVRSVEDRCEVPIGRPFAGAELIVVDPDGKPFHRVPYGGTVIGELVVAGSGVAKGYWKSNTLVHEGGFRPHPIDPTQIAYWTGDRVRRDESGVYHFLGRLDDQIKVRGVRVSPDDVADRIRQHPGVEAVAVVADRDGSLTRLVAAVVENGYSEHETIRREVSQALPSSMRPDRWLCLDAIPMTSRGKVDRDSILANAVAVNVKDKASKFDDSVEQAFATIWSRLLGHHDFSRDDDFFFVGGHSLSAAMLLREVEHQMNVTLTLSQLFEASTIASQAALVNGITDQSARIDHSMGLVRRLPCQASEPKSLSIVLPGLPGLGDLYEPLARQLATDTDCVSLSLPGIDGYGDVPTTIEGVASCWEGLLQFEIERRPLPICVYAHSFSASVLYLMLNHRPEWHQRINRCVLLDAIPHQPLHGVAGNVDTSRWQSATNLDGLQAEDIRRRLGPLLRSPAIKPTTRLAIDVEFVVASESKPWLAENTWDHFYRAVDVVECVGTHSSIVGFPGCNAWLLRQEDSKTDGGNR